MPARKIRVGTWELQHHILKPTRCLLQTHTERLQRAITPPQDPLITFHLTAHPPTPHSPPKDDAPRTIAIHRCLLRAAGGPLEALVTAPFQEASQSEIVIHETFESFDIIRRFLYCLPIKMLHLPPDLPLVADRWGLTTLFEACFTHAEERAHPHANTPKLSMPEMVMTYLPIMSIVDVPDRFKTYFAVRLAVEMRSVDKHFRQHPVEPKSVDDICCVQHDQSVTCRRRRAVCAGKDQHPCTTIENASVSSASVKCLGEPADDTADVFGDGGKTATQTAEKAEETVEENPEIEPREKTAKENAEDTVPDGTTNETEKEAEEASREVALTTEKELSNGEVERDESEHSEIAASDGVVATDAKEPAEDGAETIASTEGPVEEPVEAKEPEADMNGDIASNPDDTVTSEGEQPQDSPEPQAAGEEGDAIDLNGTGATSDADEEQQSNNAENEAQSDGEGSIADGSVADGSAANGSVSDGPISEEFGIASTYVSGTSKAQSDASDSDAWSVEDPATSDTPLHEEWHDNFNMWEVFHNRDMLERVVQYISLLGGSSCTPLILDIALRQLEPKLSDEEIIKLLRHIDWEWENADAGSLTSHASNAWNVRAWRLLARAKSGISEEGEDIRMRWNYDDMCQAMHARASELANRSNSGSDSDSSHSSDDDDTEFVKEWGKTVSDGNLEFTMSVQCDRMTLDNPSSLNLRIRYIELDDVVAKRNGSREVAVQIKCIESGCGCDLPSTNQNLSQGYIIANTGISNVENTTTLWQFKESGTNYKIMSSDGLHDWISRHRKECGMVFHVRLYVYPSKEDESEKKTKDKEDEDDFECTCGFCDCEPCRLEAQQAGQQSEQGSQSGVSNN